MTRANISTAGQGEEITASDLDIVLGLIPDAALLDDLESKYEDGDYELNEDSVPLWRGNSVAGEPWGWFREYDADDAACNWRLLPMDFHDQSRPVVEVSAWQSMSMTGAVFSGGAKALGELVVAWQRGDDGLSLLKVCRATDWAELALETTRNVFGDGDLICPKVSDHGWELGFAFDQSLSSRTVESCLDAALRPCGDDPSHEYVFVHGRWYGWIGTRWALQSRPPRARLISLIAYEEPHEAETLDSGEAVDIWRPTDN